MSAFQAYAGGYLFQGRSYTWRCYATTQVHALQRAEHAPYPRAKPGLRWVAAQQPPYEDPVVCLVDERVGEFSHILLQIGCGAEASQAARSERLSAAV